MKAGWEVKRLGEVCTLQRGFDLPTKDRRSGDVPLVSSSGIVDFVETAKVRGPGVATGRSGSIGAVFYIDDDFWPLNTALYVKDFHGNDPKFVCWLLRQFDLRKFSSGVGVPTLNRNSVHDEQVLVPTSINEQRRIVAVLDQAFAAIATATANAQKNLTNARALFESHLQSIFVDEQQGWSYKPFEACLQKIKYTQKIQRKDFKAAGEFPIVSQEADFINGYWDKRQDVLRVNSPLVIFGDHTQVLKYIDFDFVLGADGVKLLLPTPTLSAKFLLFFLMANPIKSIGYARHYRLLKEINVGFPSLPEQLKITECLDELSQQIAQLEEVYRAKIAALNELKQSLLQKAFAGELT